eukprot:TRINITY_DN33416_c0_g1_i1.p1 TRINITY_DN33416_c0_g1~~TRINITY_DN33416_c0_g1_i1.p1  ORF type:complete len:349 (+),score=55.13 TRINITY_DN33416_c0_g1_i1:80-1126(+)
MSTFGQNCTRANIAQNSQKERSLVDGQTDVARLCETLSALPRDAVTLNLKGLRLGNAGAMALAPSLATHTALTSLDMSNNTIDSAGVESVAAAIIANEALTHLNLSQNDLGPEGADYMSLALRENTTLTQLCLAGSRIGHRGARSLAAAIGLASCRLANLDLAGNSIADLGAKHFAEVLPHTTSLTALDLQTNNIGDAGLGALLHGLQDNHSMVALELGNMSENCIWQPICVQIRALLKHNRHRSDPVLVLTLHLDESSSFATERCRIIFRALSGRQIGAIDTTKSALASGLLGPAAAMAALPTCRVHLALSNGQLLDKADLHLPIAELLADELHGSWKRRRLADIPR